MTSLNRDLIMAALTSGLADDETDDGVRTSAGLLDIKVLTRVFKLLNAATKHTWDPDACYDDRYPLEAVEPRFVLARAWNPIRLVTQKQLTTKGVETPPPNLVRVRFPGIPDYYLVNDGMHRTVAARLAKKPHILARVGKYDGLCKPQEIVVIDGCVKIWPHRGTVVSSENAGSERWGWRQITHIDKEPAGYADVLETLGISVSFRRPSRMSQLAQWFWRHH